MTLPDPYVVKPDGSADVHGVQRNFEELAKRLIETGGQSLNLRVSTGTLTWPGGVSPSNTLTVNHGLARTPKGVLVTASTANGLNTIPSIKADNYTATTFDVRAATVDAQNPLNTATLVFAWLALG